MSNSGKNPFNAFLTSGEGIKEKQRAASEFPKLTLSIFISIQFRGFAVGTDDRKVIEDRCKKYPVSKKMFYTATLCSFAYRKRNPFFSSNCCTGDSGV